MKTYPPPAPVLPSLPPSPPPPPPRLSRRSPHRIRPHHAHLLTASVAAGKSDSRRGATTTRRPCPSAGLYYLLYIYIPWAGCSGAMRLHAASAVPHYADALWRRFKHATFFCPSAAVTITHPAQKRDRNHACMNKIGIFAATNRGGCFSFIWPSEHKKGLLTSPPSGWRAGASD